MRSNSILPSLKRNRHLAARGFDARKQRRHVAIVGEADHTSSTTWVSPTVREIGVTTVSSGQCPMNQVS